MKRWWWDGRQRLQPDHRNPPALQCETFPSASAMSKSLILRQLDLADRKLGQAASSLTERALSRALRIVTRDPNSAAFPDTTVVG